MISQKNYRPAAAPPPSQARMSAQCEGLITGLVCNGERRLTFEAMREHPFFSGLASLTLKP